ncbi:TRAP transporter substrate-binding protein DctP [Roseovarius amoyensis]|uniref:TRAP transporter substrate-binding protein DctP n=1 Tax=Roseovarius amoyensis TaxID=2211448 RepID=UPI000DBE30A7|nr:TRAP transporter substrate-binding protein DctP [Roseovarius amoyensis]
MKNNESAKGGGVGMVLGSALAVSMAVAALSAPVQASEVKWDLSVDGKPRAFTANVEALAAEVDRLSGGEFQIKVHFGGALAPARETLDGIKIGAFDAGEFCATYHPGKNPGLMGLSLPFLPILNLEEQQEVLETFLGSEAIRGELAQWNAVPVMGALVPRYEIMGKGKPPLEMEDWNGRRLSAPVGLAAVMETFGTITIYQPAGETYGALDRGVTDAVGMPYSYAFSAYKIQEISDWYTTNLALGSTGCLVVANTASWESLPEKFKAILEEAKLTAYEEQRAAYEDADDANVTAFAEAGLTEVTYTDEQRAGLTAAAKPIWDAWVKEVTEEHGLPGAELLDLLTN